ncbi:MAG: chromosomal replication initiator protein DnaA [Parachlamydiaceae bacterium]|nr:chromosomal replication initiator protein DnaA [Parachlamydiaceae bacterium]
MQAWEQFLQSQEVELGIETVKKWLRNLKIQRFDACNLYLEARDSFQALWFEEHIRSKAHSKLFNGNNKRIKVHLAIANAPLPQKKSKEKLKKKDDQPSFLLTFDELDPLCTFQNSVVNEDNQLTHKLLTEIAGLSKNKSQSVTKLGSFNPIYLYGKGGSGKTHMLMSLAHAFQTKGLKIVYVRADTFTDHVVTAIRAGQMSIFRQAYRNIDALIVDDVHIFSRRGATQEEFFHTFNTLHLEGKQIILSANCSPQELQMIEPRLVSRFEWGIVLPMKPLQKEEMQQILNIKAEALQFPLPPKIAEFLVETFVSNPKALIKALEAIILRSHIDPENSVNNLSIPAVKTLLADLLIEEQKSTLTNTKIIQAVADQYGIRAEDILGKAQSRDCSLPRQLAMYLCRQQLKLPFMKIGEIFSRDHSTVMSGIKQIQTIIDANDRELTSAYFSIIKKL